MNNRIRSIHRRIRSFILTPLSALRKTGDYYVRCMTSIADRLEYEGGDELQNYLFRNAQISARNEGRELIAAVAEREALLRSQRAAEGHGDFGGGLRVGESLILIRSPTSYAIAERKPASIPA